jgi:GNAT superfamily N-acetyltransferase
MHIDIKNSIITEDQAEVQDTDIAEILKASKNEHLPFVVAVKGNAPVLQAQSFGKSSKPPLPKFETIVGFGFAQTYAYGFRGKRDGRSRATVELQFYVHHEYNRKGVGRSLLDRLIQSLSHSYA